MAACKRCKSKALVTDDVTGDTVCSSCSVIQDFTNFQDHFGGGLVPSNTFVRIGTQGDGTHYTYKERKHVNASRAIDDVIYRLGLAESRTREVKDMVSKVTEGEFGMGEWFPVLVGACCYIVMRLNHKVITINEVCDVVGSDLYEMGRMISRVVEFLGLDLPEFDVVGLLERTMRGFSGFREVDDEKVKVMVKQGIFVVQCAIKWFLTTGRRPGPVVVAVLVFVAGVNGIKVEIEEVSKEVNVTVSTCKLRYKELLKALVEVAKGLPWGANVNVKNILKNGPLVMKFMEMKSMESGGSVKRRRIGNESDEVGSTGAVVECVNKDVGYGTGGDGSVVDTGSGYLSDAQDQEGKKWDYGDQSCGFDINDFFGDFLNADVGSGVESDGSGTENRLDRRNDVQPQDAGRKTDVNDLNDLKVAHEEVAKLFSKFKADIASRKLTIPEELNHDGAGLNKLDIQIFDEWWSGRSDLCEKLLLGQLEEKDVGLDVLPPSYIRGCIAVKWRREKITAAKMRISSILYPSNVSNSEILCSYSEAESDSGGVRTPKNVSGRKKRKKQHGSIDWEDFIIETLLLHKVKEEEIEKGHYKALLGLYVFNS